MKATDVVAGLTLIGLLAGIPGWVDADDNLREQTVFTLKLMMAEQQRAIAEPYEKPKWAVERRGFALSEAEARRVDRIRAERGR